MKLDKNYKVRVTPEQSRQIQELLFDCGFQWAMTGQTIHSDREIILIEPDKLRLLNGAKSTLKFYIEIAADDLIALLTDLSKSAETPLQNIELTPEFEVVEPTFKVGDKVYKYGETDLKTVLEVFEDGYMRISNYPYRVNHEVICHATPENHAMLSKPYPHIKFEAPPKELTGSDLARAMLERGDRRIYGYASDNSDNDPHGYECVVRDYDVNSGFGVIMSNARYEFFNPCDPRTGEPLTEAVLDE